MGTLQRGQSKQLQETLSATQTPSTMVLPTPELEKVAATTLAQNGERIRGKELDTDLVLVLENVLAGFERPSFMDIKLGARLWADDAPPAKRAKLDGVASKTTSGSLGFRIAGMQIWEPSTSQTRTDQTEHSSRIEVSKSKGGAYRAYDKFYGRSLTNDNVGSAFEALLLDQSDESTREYMGEIIRDIDESIEEIESVLAVNESRMYSASVLLVFEGDAEARKRLVNAAVARAMKTDEDEKQGNDTVEDQEPEDENDNDEDEEEEKKLFDVRIIDFAHAAWTPGQGPDENMLNGVRNVRRVIQGLFKTSGSE